MMPVIERMWRTCWTVTVLSLSAGRCPVQGAEVKVWNGDYVPPPRPLKTEVTVGAYVFPGWYRDEGKGDYPYKTHDEDSEWRQVAKCPKPRPLLGFYEDSLPEVNDWHIKWALEHGVSFFCFDWYWNAGEHRLLRTLERGFLKAKYCDQMKFCIHWCNHGLDWRNKKWNRPLDEDFRTKALVEMSEYLADNYFKLPNYLRLEGRPVLVVWDAKSLIQANGGAAGFAAALDAMNKALRDRGIPTLYLLAMSNSQGIRAGGFAATTGYGYYGTDYTRSTSGAPAAASRTTKSSSTMNRCGGGSPLTLCSLTWWPSAPTGTAARVPAIMRPSFPARRLRSSRPCAGTA